MGIIQLDWTAVIEKAGIGGALILLIWFGFQGFKMMIEQWKNSTDAVNKNTEAFTKLSDVFEKSTQREIEFQEKVMAVVKDTNKKVNDIHEKIV